MIRIGIRSDLEFIPEAARLGCDYLELPLSRIQALSDAEFAELAEYLDALGLRAEVMHDMLPSSVRVTGPDVQARVQHAYLDSAFARAKRLGAEVIAFDAAKVRQVPAGFDFPLARRQAGNFLRIAQGHAAVTGLRLAVQNLRTAECNLINTVSEAALMAALLQLDNVGVLADTVQMAFAAEPLDAVERCCGALEHVHAGCALTRRLPREGDGEDYAALFRALARMGYAGRVGAVAAEPFSTKDAEAALACLRSAREASLT